MNPNDIARTAGRARRATEVRNSLSVWVVTRSGDGEGTVDPNTGDWTPPTNTTFDVPAHFKPEGRPAVKARPDVVLTVQGPRLCVAASEQPLRINDTVTLKCGGDTSHMGRFWRVIDEPGSSYSIHREYAIEEVTQ